MGDFDLKFMRAKWLCTSSDVQWKQASAKLPIQYAPHAQAGAAPHPVCWVFCAVRGSQWPRSERATPHYHAYVGGARVAFPRPVNKCVIDTSSGQMLFLPDDSIEEVAKARPLATLQDVNRPVRNGGRRLELGDRQLPSSGPCTVLGRHWLREHWSMALRSLQGTNCLIRLHPWAGSLKEKSLYICAIVSLQKLTESLPYPCISFHLAASNLAHLGARFTDSQLPFAMHPDIREEIWRTPR